MSDNRSLTDDDVKAIVTLLKTELVKDFYGNVGRGVWAWFQKIVFAALFAIAVYGAAVGKLPHDVAQTMK
jgi:hypothetical protein